MSSKAPRFWTCHWQNRYWRDEVNEEYAPVRSSGSNSFHKRGVCSGDVVYVISLLDGQLLLGGKMTVDRIISRDEAMQHWQNDEIFDAREWIIGVAGTGTPLNLHRAVSPELARRLEFHSSKFGRRGLFFLSDTRLDGQATRGVHQLARESAELLDQIIEKTDSLPYSETIITVTEQLLDEIAASAPEAQSDPGDGFSRQAATYDEGGVQRILVDRYERDSRARDACIRHYGTTCVLCGFDFVEVYGDTMKGFIHVHHLSPLATVGPEYQVDPIRDLRPVCPNCHAVLHHQDPACTLDDVRRLLEGNNRRA